MEPLFTTETAYTFEEYNKYNKALTVKKLLVMFLGLLLCFVLICLITKDLNWLISGVISIAIVGIIFPVVMKSTTKKHYYTDKHLQKNYMYQFSFYQYYFEVKTNSSFVKFNYDEIHSIVETKTHFYIMKSMNQGFLIVKANCSPELIGFISNLKNKRR